MKTLLRFLLFFFVILPMQAQVTPPHDTGFESADGFTFGNLSGQNNWSMDQGTANVIDTDDRSGTYSVKVEASSPFTRISRGTRRLCRWPESLCLCEEQFNQLD